MNGEALLAWDADHVAITELKAVLTVSISEDTTTAGVNTVVTGSGTFTYDFPREAWTPEAAPTSNYFQIITGNFSHKPTFGTVDGNPPAMIKDLSCEFIPGEPATRGGARSYVEYYDTSNTMVVTTVTTPGGTANDTYTITFVLRLTADSTPVWSVGVSMSSGTTSRTFYFTGVPVNGPAIQRLNLLTVAGDLLDFGTTVTGDIAAPVVAGTTVNYWSDTVSTVTQVL